MTESGSSIDWTELLQSLRLIAPDFLKEDNRRLILPQKLGFLERPEYVENIQEVIQELNECMDMLNAGLISEEEYERKKSEIFSSKI